MLGHADVMVKLRTYAHVMPHMQEQAARVMSDIIALNIPGLGSTMGSDTSSGQ
jgi:hypothetical protein